MEKTYKHKLVYLVAKEEGELKGVLPLFLMKSFIFGKKLVSVPFALYGYVCADNETVEHALAIKLICYNNKIQRVQLTYTDLLANFRKGLRNGNWRKLRRVEKALFQASIWYSRRQGTIINELVVDKLSVLVAKLKVTKGARVFKRGYEKAAALLSKGENVFVRAPSFKAWLKDPDYVFWLGAGGLRIGS